MPVDTIQGSVGMHHKGTTKCYNFPNDVTAIVRLLNLIDNAEGGISSTQPTASASPVQIFRAIRHFQQTQNDLGRLPKLSVDGHVDPGASTCSRLNEIARKIQPVQPEDIFLPPLREAIPGFDVTADDGTIIELPRQYASKVARGIAQRPNAIYGSARGFVAENKTVTTTCFSVPSNFAFA